MGPPPPPPPSHRHYAPPRDIDELLGHDALIDGYRDDTIGMLANPKSTRFDWVPYGKFAWNPMRVMSLILLTGWVTILWTGWLVKRIINEENEYSHYLTNITWSLVTIYTTFKLAGYLESAINLRSMRRDKILYWTYYILFWPTFTTVWVVTWLVMIVLVHAPQLLTDEFETVGPGWTFLGNFAYHVAPLLLLFVDGVLTLFDHIHMLWRTTKSLLRYIVLMLILSHSIIIFYSVNYNFQVIYEIPDVPIWFILLSYEVVGGLGVAVLIMIPLSALGLTYRVGVYDLEPVRDAYKDD